MIVQGSGRDKRRIADAGLGRGEVFFTSCGLTMAGLPFAHHDAAPQRVHHALQLLARRRRGDGSAHPLPRLVALTSRSDRHLAAEPAHESRHLSVLAFPMAVWWGPEIVQFYNDGYRPFLGKKHPRSMGPRRDECWAEDWKVCGPLYRHGMTTGDSTWS